MAIYGVTAEKIEPGDKRGYAEIIKRVVAQRERDQLQKATAEDPALDIGTCPSTSRRLICRRRSWRCVRLTRRPVRYPMVVRRSDSGAPGRSTTNDRPP